MKFYLLIITLVIGQFKTLAQARTICNDTNLVEIKPLKIGSSIYTVLDFKVDLDSGRWHYFDSKHCKKGALIIQGEFLKGKRHGEFKYYSVNYSYKKGRRCNIRLLVNYENGLLNGSFVSYATNGKKTRQGYFLNGKKDGFFIDYDYHSKINRVKAIEFYQNDSLIYSKNYDTLPIE